MTYDKRWSDKIMTACTALHLHIMPCNKIIIILIPLVFWVDQLICCVCVCVRVWTIMFKQNVQVTYIL